MMNWVPVVFYYLPANKIETIPETCFEISNADETTKEKNESKMEIDDDFKWKLFMQIFEKELRNHTHKTEKKKWEVEEDQFLIDMKNNGMSWIEISERIANTNSHICKRRYERLIQNEKKWPKIVNFHIKELYETMGKSWKEIQTLILENYANEHTNLNMKRIKEKYFFHLRSGIEQREWTFEEDLQLIGLLRNKNKKWRELAEGFEKRTELQLKNRYNGTLKQLEKRAWQKAKLKLKNSKLQQEAKCE